MHGTHVCDVGRTVTLLELRAPKNCQAVGVNQSECDIDDIDGHVVDD